MKKKPRQFPGFHKQEKDRSITPRVSSHAVQKKAQGTLERAGSDQERILAIQKSIGNQAVQRLLLQRQALLRQEDETEGNNAAAVKAEEEKTLSGPDWVEQFPTGIEISDLDGSFSGKVQKFVDALKSAGAEVTINATRRPVERAYLMHWAWMIVKRGSDPRKIPAMKGVGINWWHGNLAESRQAAQGMVDKYKIDKLKVPPSLKSYHIIGKAIDMQISWGGELKIKNAKGMELLIKSSPKDHTNKELIALGKTYGVYHFKNVDKDKVHWSVDGR